MCSGAGNPAKPTRWGAAGGMEAAGRRGTEGVEEELQGEGLQGGWGLGGGAAGGGGCRGEGAAAGTPVCPEQVPSALIHS